MTWQLGSLAILALALTAGFAWYERTRPDAKIVALVGVLAAFAALGRIAFAAVPNVKPTTDIVLISGYALGGAPGFVVGALAGLTSNFFFGQGPWTPWQMAAWGAAGVIGAGMAVVTRNAIRRWPLAVLCALVGYLFAVVQDFGDWVNFSDHSAAQLGVYLGKGVGFDFVHAAGCLMFALAFGPALTRSLGRFAARLQVVWRVLDHAAVLAIVAILGLAATAAPARAAATPTSYLLGAENSDGGFGASPGSSSSPLFSGWAALGLAADGRSPQAVSRGGSTLLDYVRSSQSTDIGSVERTILVLRAAGVSATSQIGSVQGHIRSDGSVSDQVNLTAFAVLALRSAGVSPPSRTLSWIARQQNSDGGFSFSAGGGSSDIDDTGAALQALRSSPRAVTFIRSQQNPDGGFPAMPGGASNAQSTAWAVQGLLAAGANLGSLPHGSPIRYLRSLIAADGHVRYSSSSDQTQVWVTGQALMALALKPLPLAPAAQPPAARAARAAGPAGRGHGSTKGRHGGPHARRSASPARIPPDLARLAADAGIVAALALAPVGLG